MTQLGTLAVIIKHCLMCGKKTEIDSDVCSVECWLKWKELSKEIDESYNYDRSYYS